MDSVSAPESAQTQCEEAVFSHGHPVAHYLYRVISIYFQVVISERHHRILCAYAVYPVYFHVAVTAISRCLVFIIYECAHCLFSERRCLEVCRNEDSLVIELHGEAFGTVRIYGHEGGRAAYIVPRAVVIA